MGGGPPPTEAPDYFPKIPMKKILTLFFAAGLLLAGCAKSDRAVSPSSGAGDCW